MSTNELTLKGPQVAALHDLLHDLTDIEDTAAYGPEDFLGFWVAGNLNDAPINILREAAGLQPLPNRKPNWIISDSLHLKLIQVLNDVEGLINCNCPDEQCGNDCTASMTHAALCELRTAERERK